MKKSIYDLHFPFTPKATPRPRFTRKGIPYYPAAYQEYQKKIAARLLEYEPVLITGPVAVSASFFIPRPKKSKHEIPRGNDFDNLIKGPLDMITKDGRWYEDDSQITIGGPVCKFFVSPGTEGWFRITVEPAEQSAVAWHDPVYANDAIDAAKDTDDRS